MILAHHSPLPERVVHLRPVSLSDLAERHLAAEQEQARLEVQLERLDCEIHDATRRRAWIAAEITRHRAEVRSSYEALQAVFRERARGGGPS